GNADVTFDTDGRLTTDSGVAGPDNFFAVTQQADGKLVAVGQAGSSGGFFVARYNADGSLDTNFGTGGKVVTDLGSVSDELAFGVRIESNGKIVVIGASAADGKREEIVMARYSASGVLDNGFGTKGIARTDVQIGFAAFGFVQGNGDVAITPDGKFVVAMPAPESNVGLLRFLPNGKLDTTFGTGGTLTYDLGLSGTSVSSVTVQPDGKIIATFAGGLARAVRFNVDGSVDTGFGVNGVVSANPAATLLSPGLIYTDTATVHEALVLPDGDVLLLGTAFGSAKPAGSPLNFTESLRGGVLMLRYNSNGTPDNAFGTNGVKEVVGTSVSQLADATLDEAGKIIVLGGNGFARILQDGRADPGFGPNGIGASGFGSDLLVQADGRVVIAGGNAFSPGDARLSRFTGGPVAGALRLNVLTELVREDGGMLVIPVERVAGLDGAVSVTFSTTNGTALAGSDFTAVSQTLSWANLEIGVKTVSIPITDDLIADANETFTFNLTSPTGGAILSVRKTGTVTIIDDDQPGVIEFTGPSFTARENDGVATFVVKRRDGDLGAVSASYSVTGGTAVDGQDFNTVTGMVQFANGETQKTIAVPLIDDFVLGEDKTVIVTLTSPLGGATLGDVPSARLTIQDDEVPLGGVFGFGAAQFETREDSGGYLVTVLRTGGSNGAATVNLTVAAGTARDGLDFIPFVSTLNFLDGQTSVSAFIPIFDNAEVNPERTVLLSLAAPTGDLVLTTRTQPVIGADGAATLAITDNDAFPVRLSAGDIQILGSASTANEKSGRAPIVLLRTDGSFGEVSVLVSFADGTARAGQDFTGAPILVEFANGELSKTVFVPVRNDLINEPAQTFTATLTNPTGGAALGFAINGTVTIVDNDTPALADFNNDGKLDLIAQKGSKLLLHPGDGAGGFAPVGIPLPAVKGAKGFVVGDFDGDGNADLALATKKSAVLLAGNGDGTFDAPVAFESNKSSKSLLAADFNGDGRLDLAALAGKGVNVLLNNGAGFDAPRFTPALKVLTMVAGDFNEDGSTDLGIVTKGKSGVFTLLNDGSGMFAAQSAAQFFGKGVKAASVVAADLNGDDRLDIAAIVAKNQIAIAPGNGLGGFGPATSAAAGKGAKLLVLADVDDDLDYDLIATNAKKLAVLLVSNGSGAFAAPSPINVAFVPSFFTVVDLNGDEDADLVLATKKDKFRTALGAAGTTFAV
ncbi:MAG: Calx-beta domain-containing protein, partial [Chthoniobacteraceae bacterium]